MWVILAYMVSSTVLLLPAGRLADQIGRKRLYVLGTALFTLASLGAGFASSGTSLIVWRVVQGVGGALIFANAAAMVTDVFPRERLGLAMGTNVMVAAVGLVIGPVLGGGLVPFGWQWVFWFNVPFGLDGHPVGVADPARVTGRAVERSLDWAGTNIPDRADRTRLGVSDGGPGRLDSAPGDHRLTLGGLPTDLRLVESRVPAPMLDLSMFRIRCTRPPPRPRSSTGWRDSR